MKRQPDTIARGKMKCYSSAPKCAESGRGISRKAAETAKGENSPILCAFASWREETAECLSRSRSYSFRLRSGKCFQHTSHPPFHLRLRQNMPSSHRRQPPVPLNFPATWAFFRAPDSEPISFSTRRLCRIPPPSKGPKRPSFSPCFIFTQSCRQHIHPVGKRPVRGASQQRIWRDSRKPLPPVQHVLLRPPTATRA